MFLTLLTVLLGLLLLYAVWPQKEALTPYDDEESSATKGLVAKNEANIKDLQTRMEAILELQSQVETIQQSCDANTTNISSLTENCK